jgi:hypothetical protein
LQPLLRRKINVAERWQGASYIDGLEKADSAMSKPLVVCIPHRLGQVEATRRLKGGLTRAATQFPMLSADEETWTHENGCDRMAFRVRAVGQAVSGTINVREEDVQLELNLPFLLRVFAERATETIQRQGKLLLEKK